MIILEPKKLKQRMFKLQQRNKRLLMENETLNIYQLIIDESWDFDLDIKYIKCKKIIGYVLLKLNHIPSWMKNIEIGGSFNCSSCDLKSLKNCPKIIQGYFSCDNNKLTSLKNCPKIIKDGFFCRFNNLTSIEDGPTFVGNVYCCNGNDVKFTQEYVKSICKVKNYIIV